MDADTTAGGGLKEFPKTTWGFLSQLRGTGDVQFQQGMETLCRRYWKPVYRFLRATRARTNEDAKDLAQAFFLWLLEGDTLQRYERERGGFRQYLKAVLRRFAGQQDTALKRLKRGGGVRILPLDEAGFGIDDDLVDPRVPDPEKDFDRAWAKEVAQRAIDRVRRLYISEKREAQFRAFEVYGLSSSGEVPTYASVAAQLGVKESDVRNYPFTVREDIRAEIRTELSETVGDPEGLEDEWNELFGK